MKDILKNLSKWRDHINESKDEIRSTFQFFSLLICKFNAIPIKNPTELCKILQADVKIHVKHQVPRIKVFWRSVQGWGEEDCSTRWAMQELVCCLQLASVILEASLVPPVGPTPSHITPPQTRSLGDHHKLS